MNILKQLSSPSGVIGLSLCMALFLAVAGCGNRQANKQIDEKEIAEIRERTMGESSNILGKETYFAIFQKANDSINNWGAHEIGFWRAHGKAIEHQLDSVFCVSPSGNKIVFAILRRNVRDSGVLDGITYFYGVKIGNEWYFFKGPSLVLQREYYQDDIHTPLSFEKMKQIAASNIYRRYLTKNRQGGWEINERFFEQVIPSKGTLEIYNLKDFEEYVKWIVGLNWKNNNINKNNLCYHNGYNSELFDEWKGIYLFELHLIRNYSEHKIFFFFNLIATQSIDVTYVIDGDTASYTGLVTNITSEKIYFDVIIDKDEKDEFIFIRKNNEYKISGFTVYMLNPPNSEYLLVKRE